VKWEEGRRDERRGGWEEDRGENEIWDEMRWD
jgi:hypothetical protein